MSELKTGSITVDWKVDKLAELFGTEEEPKSTWKKKSPPFDGERWILSFRSYKHYPQAASVAIGARVQPEEIAQDGGKPEVFDNTTSGWNTRGPYLSGLYFKNSQDALIIRCTISKPPYVARPPLPPPPPPCPLFSDSLATAYKTFFEVEQSSDVQFLVGKAGSSKRLLRANKAFLSKRSEYFHSMFSSDFSEGASDNIDNGDRPNKRRKVERSSGPSPSPKAGSAPYAWQDDDDSLEWLPQEWLEEHGPQPVKQEQVEDEESEGVIKVTDSGYITYRAMLYFLYTERITFTPSASNFTVALAANETNNQSRRTYLLNKSQGSDGDVEPASPHAVYRLADKIGLDELKKEAKEAILAGFTAENILYEYLSSLSYQFEEIQKAALDFALAHTSEVKSTTAFKRAIDGSDMEDIDGAKELWSKFLMELMSRGG